MLRVRLQKILNGLSKLKWAYSPVALCIWLITASMAFSIVGSNAGRNIKIEQQAKYGVFKASFPIQMRRWDEDLFKSLNARIKNEMLDFTKTSEQDNANTNFDADHANWKQHSQSVVYLEQFRTFILVSYIEVTSSQTNHDHETVSFRTINYDKSSKHEIELGDVLEGAVDRSKTLSTIADYVRADLKDQTGQDEESKSLEDATKPNLSSYSKFTLCPSTKTERAAGLIFHFAPNSIADFPESHFHVTVPYTVFAKFLKPSYKLLFSGEPRQIAVDLQEDG